MFSSFAICTHPAAGMLVKHYWQTEGRPAYGLECILPKGEIELIFSFGEPMGYEQRGIAPGVTPRCFVNGMSSTPVRLAVPQRQHFFGVVLQAAAVKRLLAAPAGVFINTVTDLELVSKASGALWHQLAGCRTFDERVHLTQAWAVRQGAELSARELALSRFISSKSEIQTVAALAAASCYSSRQLHRKVRELFGMSSELLLGYRRYQEALNRVHYNDETLTSIAHACGYYDQAHFNREFKEFTGLTPGSYREQKSHLPGHLYR